jgi:hypothetical protein
MMTRTPHIINVKDAKKVTLMFGGLDIIYTARHIVLDTIKKGLGAALPGPMRDGGSRSGALVCMKVKHLTKKI